MQRFVNIADDLVDETVEGFILAHSDMVKIDDNNHRVVISTNKTIDNKVGIVSGGGSGHEPAFLGYVGKNMLDAVAVGEIFSSPTAKSFYDAIKVADNGSGVAVLYGNYAGDNMNVKMAMKMAEKEGIDVQTVVANDDICSAPLSDIEKRRGVAGEVFMWKIGAAKASLGASLSEVQQVAQKAIDHCRSVGLGLAPCTLPSVGHPNFDIEAGKMELGIGHHGEPGIEITSLNSANDSADKMTDIILQEINENSEVAVLLSGLGATPINELYVLYAQVAKTFKNKNITIYKSYVGNYFTSLDMAGATLTVMDLDSELKSLLDIEANCPGFKS